ncbi:diguanylate cyclase domain-containing protein [Roseateles amylovorans]|uniref:diguanylate cyclase n=1 Tax=Roseateles amylovorans TaxID=2978473 RepID=A0ABY6B790_9BURK|nr:diguanylate cyclase [Roseateles amylovorans]UXH79821.1 diguanylate cyclase [Roseateles amylovorans]
MTDLPTQPFGVLRQGEATTQHLLIIDDSPAIIQLIARMLHGVAGLSFATRGMQALAQMRAQAPDLVLLDAEMPSMSGFELCHLMKADPELREIPIIFVTGHGESDVEVRAFEAGAVDFITKPLNETVLLARVRTQLRIKRLTDELRRMATTDGLTGVSNRRHVDEVMQRECQRAARNGTSLAMLIVDVDHFKHYNDHYGHPAGDLCLQAVASALASVAHRPGDQVGRLGGEEFSLLLPETDLAGAIDVAESALRAVRTLALPHAASPSADHVTVSIGAASLPAPGAALHAASLLMNLADKALYQAKSNGRDRCEPSDPRCL